MIKANKNSKINMCKKISEKRTENRIIKYIILNYFLLFSILFSFLSLLVYSDELQDPLQEKIESPTETITLIQTPIQQNNSSNETGINLSNSNVNQSISEIQSEKKIPICNNSQCDAECIICSDKKCHPPDFKCITEIKFEKIVPNEISLGISQLNILVKNTGNVDVNDIYAEVSADGVETISSVKLENLMAGDKDYLFVNVNISKSGIKDLVIKIYVNNLLFSKVIGQINVFTKEIQKEREEYNISDLSSNIKQLRSNYSSLQRLYQEKLSDNFIVESYYDSLKEIDDYLSDAQLNLLEGELKKAKANIEIAKEKIESLLYNLANAKKKKVSLLDKIRNNAIYFGSMAAAIASIFSVYGIIKSNINKENLKKLDQKIKFQKLIGKLKNRQIKQEVKEQVKDEVKKEVKDEVKKEIKKEVKKEIVNKNQKTK